MQLSSSEEVTLRMPVAGGIDATLSRQKFEALCDPLWRRARLPLDAACWQAGVDLYSVLSEAETKRQELAKRGVPEWKQEAVRTRVCVHAKGHMHVRHAAAVCGVP